MLETKLKLQNYLPIIGLEVHVELSTKSKMFCACSAHHFLEKPNIHTCPVCLGLPGALPVPNQKAIDDCLLVGLALQCEIQNESKFDRKNYFYPDLPKGYQISQYDMPFCRNGYLKIKMLNVKSKVTNQNLKLIRINRVHLEEDTGKLIHTTVDGQKVTLIDFNRSGVPLVEIVSEPDLNNAEEAVAYLKKIQQIIRYLGVSDADMEKGSIRLEVNISLKKIKIQNAKIKMKDQKLKLPDYKVEIKNINSFRFVGRAINYEIERQREILETGKMPTQETRGFAARSGKTISQRSKEEADDYRYFPEPDIPPFTNLKAKILNLKSSLPELPDEKKTRFVKQYGISEYNAEILAACKKTADYFEEAIKARFKIEDLRFKNITNNEIANIIVNKKIDVDKYMPARLVEILVKKSKKQKLNEGVIAEAVGKVISQNSKAVADYKKGKITVIQFLIGRVMREAKGRADPEIIRKEILNRLS